MFLLEGKHILSVIAVKYEYAQYMFLLSLNGNVSAVEFLYLDTQDISYG